SLDGDIAPASTSTTARTLILEGDGNGTVNGIAANSVNRVLWLTKGGAGTWTLNAANTYTGTTSVQGGTLKLGSGGSISASTRIDLAAGATLDVSAVTGGFVLSGSQTLSGAGTVAGNVADTTGAVIAPGNAGLGTLAFTKNLALNGGGIVQLNLSGTNAVGNGQNDLLAVGGNLALSAPTTLEITPTGAPLAGSYQVINYGGTLTGDAANLTLSHNTRYTLSIDAATAGQIKVNVSGSAQNLTWAGDGGANAWNLNSDANWNGATEKFFHLDNVTFDETTENTAITVDGTVIPHGITVNGSRDYTFVGSGGINGAAAGLTKNGIGTLTLITNNSYTGPTQVNDGTLIVTGSISGSAVTVGSGAILGGSGTINTNNQPFVLGLGAQLSPGTAIGTLTVNTGTASFDLSAALSLVGSSALAFELDSFGFSDKIILAGGTLNIGTGVL
ncbi:MAG: hypothetical protein EOP84_27885, partial [Verrucomicrobiaceae bacterium]